ncbi:MAG: hypothetical protein FWC54_01225 [Actinomycetia bacterium]|nr:hypothetical protein [Actinomycetes bacterium]
MTAKYDDSLDSFEYKEDVGAVPKPHVKIIVDGKSIYLPGMKTYFVGDSLSFGSVTSGTEGKNELHTVGGTYCSCDTVRVGERLVAPAGTGEKETRTGPGTDAGSGATATTCSCDTVDTCRGNCGCVSYTSNSGGGGGSVSCGSPCACVPVH